MSFSGRFLFSYMVGLLLIVSPALALEITSPVNSNTDLVNDAFTVADGGEYPGLVVEPTFTLTFQTPTSGTTTFTNDYITQNNGIIVFEEDVSAINTGNFANNGLLDIAGDFTNGGTLSSNSQIIVSETLTNNGTITNSGTLTVEAGASFQNYEDLVNNNNITVNGTFTMLANGDPAANTPTYSGAGGFSLSGTSDTPAALNVFYGTFTNGGNFTTGDYANILISGNNAEFINNSTMTLSDSTENPGSLNLNNGASFTNNGNISNYKSLGIYASSFTVGDTGTYNSYESTSIDGSSALNIAGTFNSYAYFYNDGDVSLSVSSPCSVGTNCPANLNFNNAAGSDTTYAINAGTITLTGGADANNIATMAVKDNMDFDNSSGTIELANEFTALSFAEGSVLTLGKTGVIDNSHNGSLTMEAGSTLKVTLANALGGAATSGQIIGDLIVSGLSATSKITLAPTFDATFTGGDYVLVTGDITTDGTTAVTVNPFNYYNSDYSISWSGDFTTLSITKKTPAQKDAEIISYGGNQSTVDLFHAYVGTAPMTNAAGLAIQNGLNTLYENDIPGFVKAANALLPKKNGISTTATNIATQTMTLVSGFMTGSLNTRLSPSAFSSRQANTSSRSRMRAIGLNSGDYRYGINFWTQGLYNKAESTKSQGFDSNTWGYAVGADYRASRNSVFGVGYSYSDTEIKQSGGRTDADTHTAFVYGEYKPSRWFTNAVLSYGYGRYKDTTNVLGTSVEGKYNLNTYGLQMMAGYEYRWLTPLFGARFFYIDQEEYTDTAGQQIRRKYSSLLTGVVGTKLSKTYRNKKGMILKPELKLALTYDFISPDNDASVRLSNGLGYQVRGEELSKFGFEIGAAVAIGRGPLELAARYDGKFRSKYSDHTGMLELKYNF